MTDPRGLDLGEDRQFQQRFWIAERVAWGVMVLIIAAALIGLTGHGGPFARATFRDGSASIDYPRVGRWTSSEHVRLTLDSAPGGRSAVDISRAFSDLAEIDHIQPEPSERLATPSGQRFIFQLGEPGGPADVTIHFRPRRISFGRPIEFRVNERRSLQVRPVILP